MHSKLSQEERNDLTAMFLNEDSELEVREKENPSSNKLLLTKDDSTALDTLFARCYHPEALLCH